MILVIIFFILAILCFGIFILELLLNHKIDWTFLAFFLISLFGIYYFYKPIIKIELRNKQERQKIYRILSKKAKPKYQYYQVYLYGKMIDNSQRTNRRIIQCYKKFHSLKSTAECVKAGDK